MDSENHKKFKEIERLLFESVKTTREYTHDHIEQIDKKYKLKCDTQDEIIDLISVEISKDSKKKSDIIIEQQNINTLITLTNEKFDENVAFMEEQVDSMKEEVDSSLQEMSKKMGELDDKIMSNKQMIVSNKKSIMRQDMQLTEREDTVGNESRLTVNTDQLSMSMR